MNKKANEITEQSTWQELTVGCEIYEPGTSRLTLTGEWRSKIPVWDAEKCRHALHDVHAVLPGFLHSGYEWKTE